MSRRLRRGWRLARVLLTSQYALMLEYRAEIVLWALSGLLPLIMLGVWSGPGAADGLGFSADGLTRYFLAVFLVRQFTVVWLIHAFEEDVLEGRLSPFLLQPLQPLWRYVAAHLAEQATRLPFVAAILAVVLLLHPGALGWPAPADLLLGLVAIELAFALRFLIQALVTMMCFWSERAAALDRLLLIPYLFLSGLVAPLEAFPEGARQLALATPFPYMVAFPARLLTGSETHAAAGFAVMAGWGLVLLPATAALWRAGIRRYSAMGA